MSSSFPEPHIKHPQPGHPHIHTAILLHGRASSGPEFADDMFSSYLSHGINLVTAFPTWRWVFPTSRVCWSNMFQEEMFTWFEEAPLSAENNEPEAEVGSEKKEQRTKTKRLRNSVGFIVRLLEKEVGLLEDKGRVFLGGISQDSDKLVLEFLSKRIFGGSGLYGVDTAVLSTPVLLMHGTDDGWVPVELGRQSKRVVEETMGMSVEWLEFSAAENDGHWTKEPEGFDKIAQFFGEGTSCICKRLEA